VMRHPIDRLVSHDIHQWSQNVFKCDINQAIEQYQELITYSCYAMQLAPYFEQFGRENVLPVFSEAIRHDPQVQLEKVAKFIGYESNVLWQSTEPSKNVSRDRIRKFPGYQFLIESTIMSQLRRNVVPSSLREKIKSKLTMQSRPKIDQKHIEELTLKFDQDLNALSDWLGLRLTCENYRDIVKRL